MMKTLSIAMVMCLVMFGLQLTAAESIKQPPTMVPLEDVQRLIRLLLVNNVTDIGSRLEQRALKCSCANLKCSCCASGTVAKITVNVCVTLQYSAAAKTVTATISVNKVAYTKTLSRKLLTEFCIGIAGIPLAKVCAGLHGFQVNGYRISGVLRLRATLVSVDVWSRDINLS